MNAELKREPITFETEDSEVLAYLARCSSDLDYDRMSETVATEQKDVLLTLLYHGCHTETAPETIASEEPTTETVVFAESETQEKEEVKEVAKEETTLTIHTASQEKKERFTFKNKIFNKKMIPFVTLYAILFVAVITLIMGAVPGTGWEGSETLFKIPDSLGKGTISDSSVNINNGGVVSGGNDIVASAEDARQNYVGTINKIVTDQGIIEITSDATSQGTKEESNWFDKVCDFLSNAFGG